MAALAFGALTGAVAVPMAAQAAYACGANVENTIGGKRVVYRHCTSGSDSVRVKAIINNWPDGNCITVGPNQSLELMRWIWPGSFDRIVRC